MRQDLADKQKSQSIELHRKNMSYFGGGGGGEALKVSPSDPQQCSHLVLSC